MGWLCLSLAVFSTTAAVADEGLWSRQTLTGDWGGFRATLEERGIRLYGSYAGEVVGNLSGGIRRGTIYESLVELDAAVDLDKLVGWKGATFFANTWIVQGRGPSTNYIGTFNSVSGIEADRSARLHNLWLQQETEDKRFSLRLGQLAADDEFFISDTAVPFFHSTFSWPTAVSFNMPSGGPAAPFATPGVRIKAVLSDRFSLLAAVFNGDPTGAGLGLIGNRDRSGLAFRLNSDPLFIVEGAYATGSEKSEPDLPLTLKLGGWAHSGRFADQRFDTQGRSLADPASTGNAAQRKGNFGLYFVADKTLWRDGEGPSIGSFFRLGWSPKDRNLVGWYADAGVTYQGFRSGDLIGFAVSYTRIGDNARALDRDAVGFSGVNRVRRDDETVLEATYLAKLTPWWSLQPAIQFIRHPGGHIANPTDSTGRNPIRNVFLLALRTSITF